MAKHTPGPWHINELDGSVYAHEGNFVTSIADVDGKTYEILDANARLIALSPRMFAVLESLYGQLDPSVFDEAVVAELQAIVDEVNDAAEKGAQG